MPPNAFDKWAKDFLEAARTDKYRIAIGNWENGTVSLTNGRTPHNLRWRLEEGDCFLREIIGSGTVLYEKAHGGVDSQGRERLPSRQKPGRHASTRAR